LRDEGEDAEIMNQNIHHAPKHGDAETKQNFTLLSHDLRATLTGVLGSLDLIRTTNLDKEAVENLTRAQASAKMLEELLDLAFHLEDDFPAPERDNEPVNIETEINTIAQIWSGRLSRGKISVKLPDNLPLLDSSDKVSFHRILNNLVNNADKFSTGGDIHLSAVYTGGETVAVRVTDSGPGFNDEALSRLFQFRGRPQESEKPGSGIGLYIAKTLVHGMGGAITVRNRPEGGASISLTFPIARQGRSQNFNAIAETPDLTGIHILLAEDNTTNQLVVTQMLKSMGATYNVASDGVEALDIFEKERFDVVLLDIEMPRKSGLEVLREIRQLEDARSGTPLIALTAYVMREHRDRIEKAGADGIIAKPIAGIASLGRAILGYMYGNFSDENPNADQAAILPEVAGNIGAINKMVFDTLMETIGSETKAEFLEKVTIDLEDMRSRLIEAEASGNLPEIRAASHTLISVGGSIGAINLQRCAEALNLAVKVDGQKNRQSLNLLCIKGISEVLLYISSQ